MEPLFLEAATAEELSPDLIDKLIASHISDATRYQDSYSKYKGDVDILTRSLDGESKVNQKLANDFYGEIVDQLVGYMAGSPITYEYEEETPKVVDEFTLVNNIEDLDARTIKYTSICGTVFRLLYVDSEARTRAMLCMPWTIIPIFDESTDDMVRCIRYWTTNVERNGETKEAIRVEVYDVANVQEFIKVNGIWSSEEPKPHMFDDVPVVEFMNNDERMGDCEKVASLIDAYDLSLSDEQNEIEEFRLAYMVFKGCDINADTIKQARQTGAFGVPADADVLFLTKDINAEFIKHHKETLEGNIYRFSKSVNMNDENFAGGAQSGESRKWKLLALENRAKTKERKITAGLRRMFEIIEYIWRAKGDGFEYTKISFQYTRNIPIELKEASEMAKNFTGIISKRTLLSLLPFVEDVDQELANIEGEQDEIDIDEVSGLPGDTDDNV